MNEEILNKIDVQNMKALGVASLAVEAAENGLEVDLVNALEVVIDYLSDNNATFNQHK